MFLIGLNFLTTLATLLSATLPLVYSQGNGEVRLVDGMRDHEGRVEIYMNGAWGTICDDYWDKGDADVVCRQLGYSGAITAVSFAGCGQGTGQIWLDDVQCGGSENNVLSCANRGVGVHNCVHSEDAGVKCEIPVRLIGGMWDHEGRVEIYLNGAWGTICDDYWDKGDADVVCRQLGYSAAITAISSAFYGEGTGQIWLDDVQCGGSEHNVLSCANRGVGVHNCVHGEDAGVKCEIPEVRLVDGTTDYEGRIEIFFYGAWGTICDDSWGKEEADVACRLLGYRTAVEAVSSASYGQGTGEIWLDDVQCIGSEEHILACNNSGVGVHNCGHSKDAGVKCECPVQLVNGEGSYTGRVELFMNGEWGTVDEDPWDDTDAGVVCRELGFPYGGTGYKSAHFGQGTGPIWIDEVNCEGQETSLLRCPHQTDTSEDSHEEDVGVACNGPLRLVGGTKYYEGIIVGGRTNYEGRIEIFMNGAWGTICDDSWGIDDANVACRQLGYTVAEAATSYASYGEGNGTIWLDDVQCIGSEEHILACHNSGVGVHNCGHHEDAGVKCETVEIRLVGGTTDYEGRIEIFMHGAWGTICDDHWDMDDANVACRQLGLTAAVAATSSASYGEGTGQIWLDDVQCIGSEEYILACHIGGVGVHNCGHHQDAGVKCEIPVRLVNGEGSYTGRVELFMNGEWGTVDEDPWDNTDAGVVCRELGFPYGGTGYKSAHFGQGTGPIWIDEVNCEGQETSLLRCPHQTDTSEDSHEEDVGVACNGPLRLVGGRTNYEGRIEIFMNGAWGTICDDSWGIDDANVACRQLGYTVAEAVTSYASYGEGNGTIWLDDVQCIGSEEHILACHNSGVGVHNCGHHRDAGVKCIFPEIRLVDGPTDYEGRIEIFMNDAWGTICDDSWGKDAADVACRQLGYSAGVEAVSSASYGEGSGQIWLDDVQCIGSEDHILACNNSGVGVHNCGHHDDVGVKCEIPEVRLVDGTTYYEGRIEIFLNGAWGTICDDSWGKDEADVACRQLEFTAAVASRSSVSYGEGTGEIWLDDVQCIGSEEHILDCTHGGVGVHNCGHHDDVGVKCGSKKVRLVGGTTYYEGRIEIFLKGAWGTICDDSWDKDDADVACRQLGYSAAVEAVTSARYGAGTGEIWLDDVQCDGSEHNVSSCANSGVGIHNCGHSEDAGVKCEIPEVRLVDGSADYEGRIEIFMKGAWGTICDNSWGKDEADVVCRQLGFTAAEAATSSSSYGEGTGPILLDDVQCIGSEEHILACYNSGVGVHNCGHGEDAGVKCVIPQVRLVGGTTDYEGRIEIFINGTWGTICDDSWGKDEADVACRQLGYTAAEVATSSASYGEGTGQIWLDDVKCIGSEQDIYACGNSGVGEHNCDHGEDAGVRCEL